MISAVLLDMDGVIVDSEVHWRLISKDHLSRTVPGWTEADFPRISGLGIDDLYRLDRFEIRRPRGEVLGIHDGFVCELDISGVERMAIVEIDLIAQVEQNDGIVFEDG